MNKNSSILLIVEGAKAEKKLVEKLFEIYDINVSESQIYSYTTNIYDLYDRVFKDSLDELDDLDFLLTLKEKGINKAQQNILTDREYSDVILIFDYEPQDDKFSIDKIAVMMKYFSESTDKGKLYLNYPSVESFKHFKSIPDPEYINRYYYLNELLTNKGSVYKQIVGNESIVTDLKKFTKDIFNYIIHENIIKAEKIESAQISNNIKESYFNLNEIRLLTKINTVFKNDKIIPVLNTCLFFICEYNINLILQKESTTYD